MTRNHMTPMFDILEFDQWLVYRGIALDSYLWVLSEDSQYVIGIQIHFNKMRKSFFLVEDEIHISKYNAGVWQFERINRVDNVQLYNKLDKALIFGKV